MNNDFTVSILYKYVEGAHFFVSNDKYTQGLCIAHKDLETAYESVGPTLSMLFKENYDEDVTFVPELSLADFKEWETQQNNEAKKAPTPGLAGTIQWLNESFGAVAKGQNVVTAPKKRT